MKNPATRSGVSRSEAGLSDYVRAFQRLVGEVFRLNGQLLTTSEYLARDLGLTPARWQSIAILQQRPLTVSQMARRLGKRRQSVQQTVNRLQEQNIVSLRPNPDHRRAPLVKLTAHGQELMHHLHGRQADLTDEFTSGLGLTITDIETLIAQLRGLREKAEQSGATPGKTSRSAAASMELAGK